MAEAGNEDQIAFWNGQAGEKWAGNQDRLDHAFAPLTASLLRHVGAQPGEAVIDVGCGCGDLTLALAHSLGAEGRVLAVDVSGPMLAQAQARAARETPGALAPIEWALQDASVYEFPKVEFDVIASRFGVMFFADPIAAFANIRSALKPGGRVTMLCWRPMDENPWFSVPRAAVLPLVPPPEPLPPGAPGPFGFADPERVLAILMEAGFSDARAEKCDADLTLAEASTDADALAAATRFSVQVGPIGSLLREASEDTIAAASVAVEAALCPYVQGGRIVLGAACWIYTAITPELTPSRR